MTSRVDLRMLTPEERVGALRNVLAAGDDASDDYRMLAPEARLLLAMVWLARQAYGVFPPGYDAWHDLLLESRARARRARLETLLDEASLDMLAALATDAPVETLRQRAALRLLTVRVDA